MAGRVNLDLCKQPFEQFVSGAAHKIRSTHLALLQVLLRREKPREGLRVHDSPMQV